MPAKTTPRSGKAPTPDLPTQPFTDQRAFAQWLARNHAQPGLWIKMAKAASGIPSINYAQALEVALCWGWIDGQSRRIDDRWFVQKFTPRARRSIWSKINCQKATALISAGKMKPPGLAEVERAKQDGRWARAYDSPSRATVPEDFTAALAASGSASAFFATLDSRNRYAILFRLQTAKKPETRARRIADFVRMLARKEKLY
jgi:uncharacterized protein YdeI (YjbR/CyaY-like superfamily)